MDNDSFYNHRTRKAMAKRAMKNTPVPILKWDTTEDGEQVPIQAGKTNRWRVIKHKEQNYTVWFERVQKSVAYGKKLAGLKEEQAYNAYVEEMEVRSAKQLEFLQGVYGEEMGTKKHTQVLDRMEKRAAKKYQI